ncbi:MAG: PocR ligand-binding domain-containing protein [Kiritimatiellae bacterium]|nr:PocR ligand-binding domain-containing protein [Kiritimatiellia bacterium]
MTKLANPPLSRENASFYHTIEQFRILKAFQKDLYLLTGLPFDFVDLRLKHSEKLRAQRVFTPFCRMINSTPFGCGACDQDERQAVAYCVEKKRCRARRCHLGLIDVYVPITMNGRVAGLFCTGQLHYRRPTDADFLRIQHRLNGMGIDMAEARRAYFSAPVIEKRRVAAIIDLIGMVVGLIDAGRLRNLESAISHDPIRKVLSFMEDHYAEPMTLTVAAKEAGLSVSRLAHVFKAQTKMNFSAYLNLIRVGWAKYYLTNSRLRISEVAFQVGFANLSHFNHIFRRSTGLTPTQHRRQHSGTRK